MYFSDNSLTIIVPTTIRHWKTSFKRVSSYNFGHPNRDISSIYSGNRETGKNEDPLGMVLCRPAAGYCVFRVVVITGETSFCLSECCKYNDPCQSVHFAVHICDCKPAVVFGSNGSHSHSPASHVTHDFTINTKRHQRELVRVCVVASVFYGPQQCNHKSTKRPTLFPPANQPPSIWWYAGNPISLCKVEGNGPTSNVCVFVYAGVLDTFGYTLPPFTISAFVSHLY